MIYITPADLSSVRLATLSIVFGVSKCKWFQVEVLSNDTGVPVLIGDSGVQVNRGIAIGPDPECRDFGPVALAMDFYDLTAIWIKIPTGDVAVAAAFAV